MSGSSKVTTANSRRYKRTVGTVRELIGDQPPLDWLPGLFAVVDDDSQAMDRRIAAADAVGRLIGLDKAPYEAQVRAKHRTVSFTHRRVEKKGVTKSGINSARPKRSSIGDLKECIGGEPDLANHEQLGAFLSVAMNESHTDIVRIHAANICIQVIERFKLTGSVGEIILLDDEAITLLNPLIPNLKRPA